MKILIASPMPPQPQAAGAIPLVLHAQLTALRPRHELTLVTVSGPDPAEWEALDRLEASGIEIQAIRRTELQGCQRWRRRWRFGSAWLRGFYPWRTIWFWEPEIQRILDRLLAVDRFHLVVAEDNSMGIYRYSTKAPVILTEHEVRRPRPVNWHLPLKTNPIAWAFSETDWSRWPRYQTATWRRFDRIQVFTQQDAEAIFRLAPELAERVRVNPFSIDLPEQAKIENEKEGNLLFVGNFTHPPNVDAALWLGHEIMPLLRTLRTGVELNLVGGSPPKAVRDLACEDIRVTGQVPRIEPYFEQAEVVLAPVRIGGGMRMKVLQAMALGKAVVTTPLGAQGLAVDGRLAPLLTAQDAREISQATARLLEDSSLRRELGRRALCFAREHHSPPAYAHRFEDILSELL